MNLQHATPRATVVAAILAFPALAADETDWRNLQKLSRGDRIGVVQVDHKRIEGRFEAADASTLQLDSGALLSLRQTEVVRVYRLGLSRSKRLLIGASIGAAAGAAIAAGGSRGMSGEGFFAAGGSAVAVAGSTAIGAAAAGFTGKGYQTIYRTRGGK